MHWRKWRYWRYRQNCQYRHAKKWYFSVQIFILPTSDVGEKKKEENGMTKEENAGLKFREQDEEAGCRDKATKMHNEGRDSIPRNYQERRT